MPARRPIRGLIGGRTLIGKSGTAATREFRDEMLKIERRLSRVINTIKGATPEALKYALQPIYDKSQILVPHNTGALKASGFIEAERDAKGAKAAVGYAANNSPHYAAFVHEMIDMYHTPPTSAKYLQYAFQDHYDEILPRIHEILRKTFLKVKVK